MYKIAPTLLCYCCLISTIFSQITPQVVLQKAHEAKSLSSNGQDKIWAVSNDSKWVMTASDADGTIVIWNVPAGKIYARYDRPEKITSARFIPGNEEILINQSVIIDKQTGVIKRSLLSPTPATAYKTSFRYEAESKSYAPTVYKAGSRTDSFIRLFTSKIPWGREYVFNKDSSRFWGCRGQRVYEYDFPANKTLRQIEVNDGNIRDIDFLEKQQLLIINSENKTTLYNVSAGKIGTVIPQLLNIQVSDDAAYICGTSLGTKSRFQVWRLKPSLKLLDDIPEKGTDAGIQAFFKGTDTIIVISEGAEKGNFISIHTLPTGKEIWNTAGTLQSCIISNNHHFLLAASKESYTITNLNTFQPVLSAKKDSIRKAFISPDEQYLLTVEAGELYGKPALHLYKLPGLKPILPDEALIKEKLQFRAAYQVDATFSPDSEHLVLFNSDGTKKEAIHFQMAGIATNILSVEPNGSWHHLKYSVDGNFLVDDGDDKKLYDSHTFQYISNNAPEKEMLRFSLPDASKIFTVTEAGSIYFIRSANTRTGEKVQLPLKGKPLSFATNADGSLMAYSLLKNYDKVNIASAVTGNVTDSIILPKGQVNAKYLFNNNNQVLYIGWDSLYQYSLPERKLINIQPAQPGRYFPMAESSNSKYLFTYRLYNNSQSTDLCIMKHGEGKQQQLYPCRIRSLWLTEFTSYYNSTDPQILEYEKDYENYYVSVKQDIPKGSLRMNSLAEETISYDNRKTFTFSSYDGLQVFSNISRKVIVTIKPYKYEGRLAFTANHKYAYKTDFAFGTGTTITVFDVQKGFRKVPFIYTAGKQNEYRYFNDQTIPYYQQMGLSDSGRYLYVLDTYNDGIAKVYEFETGKLLFSHKMPYLLNKTVPKEDLYKGLYGVIMSPDESRFISETYAPFLIRANVKTGTVDKLAYPAKAVMRPATSESGSWVAALEDFLDNKISKARLFVWDAKGVLTQAILPVQFEDYNPLDIQIYEKQHLLSVQKADGLYFFSLPDVKPVKSFPSPDIYSCSISSQTGLLNIKTGGTIQSYRLPAFEPVPYWPDTGYHLQWDAEFQYVYKDTAPIAKFIMDESNEQMLWFTPAGYYAINKSSADAVGFSYKNDIYPSSVFDAVYNRPDTVFSLLQPFFHFTSPFISIYKVAYEKRSRRTLSTRNAAILPVATVALPETATAGQHTVNARIQVTAATGELRSLNIKVNGVPVLGSSGKVISGKTLETTIAIPVLPGKNEITVTATDGSGFSSLPATGIIFQEDSASYHPKTYFIGIGVSQYQHPEYNLRYADADIRNVAALLKSKSPGMETDTLLNQQATLRNILSVRNKLLHTKPEDKVIVFFCGHGLRKQDYYLATYDIDFSNPSEKGLPVDALYGLLDSIPALQRLIMLDACNSGQDYTDTDSAKGLYGAALSENIKTYGARGVQLITLGTEPGNAAITDIMEDVFADVSNDHGANVIAATKGYEYAYETPMLKDGVFTYAVLQAIHTQINGASTGRAITVKELKNFVADAVLRLTKGKQRPTSRNENAKMNWALW